MRIGWDIAKALDPRDGVGSYCHHLLRELMAIDHDNEYRLYLHHGEVRPEQFRAAFPEAPPSFRLAAGHAPRPGEVDLFHAATWVHPVGFPGPVLYTCYDLTFLSHPECHTLDNKIACTAGTLRALLAGARFLTISRATANEMSSRLGLPLERIEIVHPAPAAAFRPLPSGEAAQRVAARFGLERPYLLAVGTLEPRKNLERLVDAYLGLPDAVRQVHPLVVAGGSGWKQDTLRTRMEDAPEVRVLGQVDEEDLVALYGAAVLFAYPSIAEGFGLPVVEAMACGTPVLTSDLSSLPEVAGDAARLVDPFDVEALRTALLALLEDPEARADLARRGRRRAERFTWRQTATRILALYRELGGAP